MGRATTTSRAIGSILASMLAAASAGAGPADVPAGFVPLDVALKLEDRTGGFMHPDTIDLAWGVSMISCPTGPWRGTVRFVGHAGGDIEYTGDMYGCFTFGRGEARYADGSRYTGSVNAYVAPGLDDFSRLTTDGVRMAVPEGLGTAAVVGVAAQQRAFVRGVPSVDAKDPRFSALDVAFVGLGRETVAAANWVARYASDPGAAIEKGIANVEREAAGVERAMVVAGGQAERLGTQVVTQGLAVSADAEAFARRGAQEAQSAGTTVDAAAQQLGKQSAKVGGAVAKLDASQTDVGGKLFGRSKPAAAAPAPAAPSATTATPQDLASCIAGRWQRPACGGVANMEVGFSGGTSGTGYRAEAACPATCQQGGRVEFRYAIAGDGTVQLELARGSTCGREAPATQEKQMLTCAGDALRFGGDFRRVAR